MLEAVALADLDFGIDGRDTAAAWTVSRLKDGRYLWSAWSDWARAQTGRSPEVEGVVSDRDEAERRAVAAARSMNPAGSIHIRR